MKSRLSVIAFCLTWAGVPAFAAQPLQVVFHAYKTSADFTQAGAIFEGAVLAPQGNAVTYGTTIGTLSYTDPYGYGTHTYSFDRWASPWFETGFGFGELVSSWNADTPPGTWIQVEMQATTDGVTPTKWYVMGRWAFGDGDFHRAS